VRSADAVAVGDCREALDVRAEQPRERLGFGLTQLGELLGDVCHRAVVLAQLFTGPGRCGHDRGRVAVDRQGLGQRFGLLPRAGDCIDRRLIALFELGDASPSELPDELDSPGVCQETQRADGKIVVGLLEGIAAGLRDDKDLGRASPPAMPMYSCLPALDHALGLQGVQVASDRRGCEPQSGGEGCGRRRAVLQDRSRDLGPGAGMRVVRELDWPASRRLAHGFHNNIVLYFCSPLNPTREPPGARRGATPRDPRIGRVTIAEPRVGSTRKVWDRVPIPADRTLVRLAVASLVSQLGIVVTGGAVRLTGSGLGCPTVPRCTEESLVPTPELGIHGIIEFGNRLLTFVLGAIAAVMLLAILRTLRSARPRRDLLVPAIVLLLGIPAQALIGMATVRTTLNPWVVMLHFMCSAALVAVATILVRRAQRPSGAEPAEIGSPWLRRLAALTLVAAFGTVYIGTVVTGTGPHAGDREAPRTGLDLESVAQVHVHAVTLLLGLSIGLYFAARAVGSPGRAARAAAVLVGVELAQGSVGGIQYVFDLPVLLVGLHMLGAAILVAAAVDAWFAARWLPEPAQSPRIRHPRPEPGADA
jgi:cytochrome c oxidase assembly protein subunit 15